MAESESLPESSREEFFDVERIRRLVELMHEHSLTEINLRHRDARIQLRRGGEPVVVSPGFSHALAPAPALAAGLPARSSEPALGTPAAGEEHVVYIKSPMVGTFYSSSDPDSPAFVKVADTVGPETVVCIVEAMKVFNQIPAEVSGRIVAMLVENGAPVEFGQRLFKVDTKQ